jgi:hypothetical protein
MRWRSRRSVLSFDTWRTLVHERGLSQEQAVEVAARLTCEACSDPCAARQSAPAVPARRVTPPSSLGERLLAGLGAKASRREDGARARLISRNVATRKPARHQLGRDRKRPLLAQHLQPVQAGQRVPLTDRGDGRRLRRGYLRRDLAQRC